MKCKHFLLLPLAVYSAIAADVSFNQVPNLDLKQLGTDQEHRLPVWSGGALLQSINDGSSAPGVQVFERSGRLADTISIRIPGANVTRISSVSRSMGGDFAACGFSTDNDGRSATFVAWRLHDSEDLTVVRTSPFAPRRVAIEADGSVWAVGNFNSRGGIDPDKEHGVLRHYDKTGRLLRSLFPSASIDRLRPYMGFVAASADRVGWISEGSPGSQVSNPGGYVEVMSSGEVVQYSLPSGYSGEGPNLYGFALTDDSEAFVVALVSANASRLFRLDRNAREWVPVSARNVPENAFLYGASGKTLAFSRSGDDTVKLFDVSVK